MLIKHSGNLITQRRDSPWRLLSRLNQCKCSEQIWLISADTYHHYVLIFQPQSHYPMAGSREQPSYHQQHQPVLREPDPFFDRPQMHSRTQPEQQQQQPQTRKKSRFLNRDFDISPPEPPRGQQPTQYQASLSSESESHSAYYVLHCVASRQSWYFWKHFWLVLLACWMILQLLCSPIGYGTSEKNETSQLTACHTV